MVKKPSSRFSDSLARFNHILTEKEIQQIIDLQAEPLPIGIRMNSLKGEPSKAIEALAARYQWDIEPIPFCENAWQIRPPEFSPGRTIEHRLGQYYLQDPASMVPVSLMDFEEDQPLILDMAASPGGKTTHMIDRTRDRGFILANDGSRSRIPALRAVLTTWSGANTVITNYPGELFGSWFPEAFDHVLLDAPCSMENFRPAPNRRLRETTDTERNRLQERQVQLLISGLKALKVGGQLVYATCSLAPEEDETVIDQVLKSFPHIFAVDDVAMKVPFDVPGLTGYESSFFHPSLVHSLRLWPHITGMSGFFCARLTKLGKFSDQSSNPPIREFSLTGLTPAPTYLKSQITEQLASDYGFNLLQILTDGDLKLFTRFEDIFLIPKVYLLKFPLLPFEYLGMHLGQTINKKFQPSSEFISRFGHTFTTGTIKLDHGQVQQWIQGHDIRQPETDLEPQGQYLLVIDEENRNLGLGKLLVKRLRNMLPRGVI